MRKDKLKEIEDLAMDCLVDLVDKDFTLTVKQLTGYCMIKLVSPTYIDWENIKEDYLFFIQIMTNDYKLVGRYPFTITRQYSSSMDMTLEMLTELTSEDDYEGISAITAFMG